MPALPRTYPACTDLSMVTSGRMFSVIPYESGCVTCLNIYYSNHDPLFYRPVQRLHGFGICRPDRGFAPYIVRLSGLIAAEAVRLLTGYVAQSIGCQVEF